MLRLRLAARPVLSTRSLPIGRRSLAGQAQLPKPTTSSAPPPPPPPSPTPSIPVEAEAAASSAARTASKVGSKVRSFLWSSVLLLGTGAFLVYAHDSRAGVWRWIVLPTVMALTTDDPEKAHEAAVDFIGSGLAPVDCGVDSDALAIEVWGKHFANPVGMAAGWDKHATAIDGLFNLGFGYVEIGSVTPEPQPGNPRPRLFRLPEIESVVNRYGFNSEGHNVAVTRLRERIRKFVSRNAAALPPALFSSPPSSAGPDYDAVAHFLTTPAGSDARVADSLSLPRSLSHGRILGVNLGKNKSSDPDSIDDFVNGIKTLGPYADVLVVNVSSPNTPGLRNLQRKGMLSELLEGVIAARDALVGDVKPPVLVKIAPDNDHEQLLDIAHAVQSSGVDGIIVSNTTISRPPLNTTNPALKETGGLSGPPVKPLALKTLSTLYEATDGKVPLVGCGGISSGQDAIDYARAGASLVQMYTSFIYHGVGLPRKIKDELMAILETEKTTWAKIVGSGRAKVTTPPKPKTELMEKKEVRATPLNEEEFRASVAEARKELDDLLRQLGDYEKERRPSTLSNSAAEPVKAAVPAPVAESMPAKKTTTSESVSVDGAVAQALGMSSEPRSSSSSSDQNGPVLGSPDSTASTPTPENGGGSAPQSARIQDSSIAVPAAALLDENAIAALLDPAKAQVDAGLQKSEAELKKGAQRKEQEVKEKVQEGTEKLKDGKRWV